ncbi:MAG: hypothetical protein VR64_16575 [Desulfatitalea sp. BRH_c12]|nr:MAG: hypothetical protein VR64_16575 [Desulfatitalea sp. BRH_c12]
MRAGIWFGFILMLAVFAGCAPPEASRVTSQEDYAVMFDGLANVYDQGVYLDGAQIGQIQSTEVGVGNVTRMMIRLSPQALQEMGTNTVFLVKMGRLEGLRLQGLGAEPLQKGAPLCGFTSTADWTWFKVKTLLNDRIVAAQKRAQALQLRFG